MSRARKAAPTSPTRRKSGPIGSASIRAPTSTGPAGNASRLPNLQSGTTAIWLRLPIRLLEQIKIATHKRDAPYQSLIKIWVSENAGWRR